MTQEQTLTPTHYERALKKLAVIALLAIALGFAMQGLILAGKLAGGSALPGAAILVDLAQGVTWSFLVCAGLGIGTSVARGRAVLGGVIAMICAPIAIAGAKSSQKVMAGLIGAAEQPAALSLATISVLRAIEYGVLGWLLTWLVLRTETRPLPYLAGDCGGRAVRGLYRRAELPGGARRWPCARPAADHRQRHQRGHFSNRLRDGHFRWATGGAKSGTYFRSAGRDGASRLN